MLSPKRLAGIVLVVVGVILLVIGVNSSHSVSDQISTAFTDRFTQATTWYIVGGIGVALLGLVFAAFGGARAAA